MALIVENGMAKTDANSYCSVAQADAYHGARGNSAWLDLDLADKETYLVRATDYLVQAYRLRWKGWRTSQIQSLDWPRSGVIQQDRALVYTVPLDTVPNEVVAATCELALKAATRELAPDLERGVASESVGPISTTYDRASPEYTRYRTVDMLLAPLLMSGPATVRVGRNY